jgi:hypothetical protein
VACHAVALGLPELWQSWLGEGGFSKDSQTFSVTSGRISGCTSVTVTTQNMPTRIQPQQRKGKP